MSASPHRVQGLANDEVAADWPPIDAEALVGLARHVPALAGGRLCWRSPRPFSAAALVETAAGTLFVKRHAPSVRRAATLAEEHRFIRHLGARGVPVVALLADAAGHTAIETDGWTWEVHAAGAGQDLYRQTPSWTPLDTPQRALHAGRMLAQLHRAAAGFHAPQRSTHLLVARDDLIRAEDPVALLHAQLRERPALAAYLAQRPWQRDLQQHLLPLQAPVVAPLRGQPRLWTHNDWHASNLLWSDPGEQAHVTTVLDFGLAAPTSALFDLATAIERNAIAWLALDTGVDPAHPQIALALLRGYRQVLPLDPAQVHLLADLLPVVHLDFALSEVEYFAGPCGSPQSADVAYDTFLLGHAHWFGTPHGQALLTALRDAA